MTRRAAQTHVQLLPFLSLDRRFFTVSPLIPNFSRWVILVPEPKLAKKVFFCRRQCDTASTKTIAPPTLHTAMLKNIWSSAGIPEITMCVLLPFRKRLINFALPFLWTVWGFGFLSVSLINICAVVGMVFLPLMKKAFYTQLLMFMVALAVGTLAGSSLLFLIPEVSKQWNLKLRSDLTHSAQACFFNLCF